VSHAAEELIEAKGGFTISSGDELQKGIETLLQSDESLIKSSYEATGVIHRNLGSATRVVRGIIKN
jgi:3-deoxy-D-manno-octulosonic-acid transferase